MVDFFAGAQLQFTTNYSIVIPVLPINGKRADPYAHQQRTHLFLLPPDFTKRGLRQMVTYSDMIQLGIRIVGIISLFIQVNNKKK